jgi:DinB superfamily
MLRASSFPDDDRHRRVNEEWSVVESLRHLVLVVDVWLSKGILGHPDPFHPIGLPPSFMPPKLPGSSIDPEAQPAFDEACQVLHERLAGLRTYVDALTQDELDRAIEAHAGSVAGALGVLFDELAAHDRFINRDLDLIESSRSK